MSSKDYRVGMTRLADCPNSLQDDMICAIDLGGDSTVDRETSYNRAVGLFKYILQQRKSDVDGRSQSSATVQYHKDMLVLTRKMVKYLELMTGEVEDSSAPPVNLSCGMEDSQLANLAAMLDKLGVARNNASDATSPSTNNAEESQKKPAKKLRKPKSSKPNNSKDVGKSRKSTSSTPKNKDTVEKGTKSDDKEASTRSDEDILNAINSRHYDALSDEDKLMAACDDFKTVNEICKSKQPKNKTIQSLFHQLDRLCKKFDTPNEKLRSTMQTQYAKYCHYFHTLNKWAHAAFDPKRPGLGRMYPNKIVQGLYTFTLWYGLAQRDNDEIFSTVDIMESELNSWIENIVKDIEGNYLENSYIYPKSCNHYELGNKQFASNMLDLHDGGISQIFNATTLSYLWILHRCIKFENAKLQAEMDSFFNISLELFKSTLSLEGNNGVWSVYLDFISTTRGCVFLLMPSDNRTLRKQESALSSLSVLDYTAKTRQLKLCSESLVQYLDS